MIHCLNVNVFIESDEPLDDVVHTFEGGAASAMDHFPKGDVFQFDTESAKTLSAEEIAERGFEEG